MSERWELIDHCAETGLRKWMNYEADGDQIQIAYDQDRAAQNVILDRNKATQADGFDKRSDMWHAAHIPVGVMYEWLVKHGVNAWDPTHIDGVKRLLNDPEYRYLRVNHFIM